MQKDQTARKPSISVVMTTYNSAPFIQEAIESVLNQTFEDFEFVIVDDASEDRTSQLIHGFKDPRIVYMRNARNVGQTESLNTAIKNSYGKYIARMDADDVSYPERLKLQYEFLENYPQIALVGSSIHIERERKKLKRFQFPTNPLEIKCFLAGSGDLSYWCLSHPVVMMRREILEEVGFYNAERGRGSGYPQDYELWHKLSGRYMFANLKKPLLKYRFLFNSDSRTFMEKQFQERMRITAEKIKYYLPKMEENEIVSLCRMLEYHPQHSSAEGKKVFSLFETYYDQYVGPLKSHRTARRIKQQLKLYYLPQLFATNKLLVLREAIRLFMVYPSFLLDKKFYRKFFKALLLRIVPKRHQSEFLIKNLFYR